MTDTEIMPIEASASGKNAFLIPCQAVGQRMSYAACLNRLAAIDNNTAPTDWNECKQAGRCNACPAKTMRADELVAGKSLFFLTRAITAVTEGVRKWVSGSTAASVKPSRRAAAKSASVLDAMGDLGGYAEAIAMPTPVAGETPLQMARRIAAERTASTT